MPGCIQISQATRQMLSWHTSQGDVVHSTGRKDSTHQHAERGILVPRLDIPRRTRPIDRPHAQMIGGNASDALDTLTEDVNETPDGSGGEDDSLGGGNTLPEEFQWEDPLHGYLRKINFGGSMSHANHPSSPPSERALSTPKDGTSNRKKKKRNVDIE
eukprot:scaffold1513_cov100-Amphora_coffeaeformis.AAC.19